MSAFRLQQLKGQLIPETKVSRKLFIDFTIKHIDLKQDSFKMIQKWTEFVFYFMPKGFYWTPTAIYLLNLNKLELTSYSEEFRYSVPQTNL